MKMLSRIFIFLVINSTCIFAAPDCIDNSWYLKKEIDLKEYHHVQCNCPCGKYTRNETFNVIADRNKCFKCGHYHNPYPVIMHSARSLETNADIKQVDYVEMYRCRISNKQMHPQGKVLYALFHGTKP